MKKKAFFIIFEGLSLKQMKKAFCFLEELYQVKESGL